jgi:hypothetical protein
MIAVFFDFGQFSAKKWRFLKNQCYVINLLHNLCSSYVQNVKNHSSKKFFKVLKKNVHR